MPRWSPQIPRRDLGNSIKHRWAKWSCVGKSASVWRGAPVLFQQTTPACLLSACPALPQPGKLQLLETFDRGKKSSKTCCDHLGWFNIESCYPKMMDGYRKHNALWCDIFPSYVPDGFVAMWRQELQSEKKPPLMSHPLGVSVMDLLVRDYLYHAPGYCVVKVSAKSCSSGFCQPLQGISGADSGFIWAEQPLAPSSICFHGNPQLWHNIPIRATSWQRFLSQSAWVKLTVSFCVRRFSTKYWMSQTCTVCGKGMLFGLKCKNCKWVVSQVTHTVYVLLLYCLFSLFRFYCWCVRLIPTLPFQRLKCHNKCTKEAPPCHLLIIQRGGRDSFKGILYCSHSRVSTLFFGVLSPWLCF